MKLQKLYVIFPIVSLFVTGCSILPTSGPNHSKILDLNYKNTNVNVVELNENLVQAFYKLQQSQLFSGFNHLVQTNGYSGMADIGDVLEISIWEAPPAVLFGGTFSSEGQGAGHLTQLPPQTIDSKGMISVPFVGNISVRGKTPEAIASHITSVLKRKANQPQVLVRIINNQSSDVTVIRQGNSIRMPLTPSGERVLDAVAAVGGSPADIQDITIQLTRANQVKTLPFETLIADPNQNILLQAGDVVSLLTTPYSFTGLGAVGNNQQMKFSTKGLTLAEAIGKMGGLIDTRSDPRGIFVFRYVPFSQLDLVQQQSWAKRGYQIGMDVPTVYRANLLDPKSMFLIQRFPVKDKDIVYVSNAPLAEFQKFLRMIFSITSPITNTVNSVNNL
ncbi:polysaccharide biosynthesis/export family protein [Rodentibacter caecimuris]|uniref:Sugar ABC transporter substrate-binding protein n=1 Tax=Rodentibacter caecimuris TaxID=1796644 RepID=A0ABX3L1G6_9PAST|nr:sugar ABC transporter substrate-binding protein [Rodentibacter heylii]